MTATSGKITHERIAEQGFTEPAKDEIRSLIEQLEALEQALVSVSKTMNGALRNSGGAKNLTEVKQIEDLLKRIDQLEKLNNETKKQKIKLSEQETAQNQIDNQLKKDRIAILKNEIAQASDQVGLLKKLEAANAALRAERNKLNLTDKNFEANLKRINSQIDLNNKAIVLSSDKQKAQTLNVGNYDRQLGVLGKTLKGFGTLGKIFSEALGIDPVIFTGIREAASSIKEIKHVLEGVTAAHEVNTVAIEAETVAQEENAVASLAALGPIGLLVGASIALGAAIWYAVGGRKAESELTVGLTGEIIKLMKAREEEAAWLEEQKHRSDESGESLEQHKSAEEELNKELNEEAEKRKALIEIDQQFARVKKGGLDDLKRELELLKAKNSYTSENFNDTKNENEKFRKHKEIAEKEQAIREIELAELKDRQKALGEFAVGDIELQQQIADKENEIKIGSRIIRNEELEHQKTLMNISIALQREGAARKKVIEDEEIKYELEAITGKYGEAEKIIAQQELQTKIELGTYTQAELEAWVALQKQGFDERKAINDKEIKYELEAIAGKHGKAEMLIARQELRTKVAQGLPLTDEEKAELKRQRDEQIDETQKYVEAITQGIGEGLQKRSDMQQRADQKDIDMHQKAIDVQAALAAGGQDNVLAEEMAAAAKAEEKKIQDAKKALKQQEAIALVDTFTKTLSAALKSNKPFMEALAEAAASSGMVSATFSKLIGGFYDGTEDTGPGGNVDNKGGKIAIIHPHERILTAEQNERIGKGVSNDKLVDDFNNIYTPQFNSANTTTTARGDSYVDRLSETFAAKIDDLKETIENKPVQSVSFTALSEWDEEIKTSTMRTLIHHKKSASRPSLRLNG